MDKDGVPFLMVPAALSVFAAAFGLWLLAGIFAILAAFMIFFFRDPIRSTPKGQNVIVSAADGKVTRIENREDGVFVSVFLSPLNVHINRSPIEGTVSEVKLFKGLKKPATENSASETNERNSLTIQGESITIKCTQIVGLLARRIVCRKKESDRLKTGEKFGLIRFGSRTDVLMPKNVKLNVSVGDRVTGGETVLALLSD